MPFSPECSLARADMQATWTAWNQAHDACLKADIARANAEVARRQADAAYEAARTARQQADTAWAAHLAALAARPGLGVPGEEAAFVPATGGPGAPGGANITGPIPAPDGTDYILWGLNGDPARQQQWVNAANDAMTQALRLARVARFAQAEEAAKEAPMLAAHADLAAAQRALATATAAQDQARAAHEQARAAALAQCSGQTDTESLPGGATLEIFPGVLPEDVDRVKARVRGIPGNQQGGLTEIRLRDDRGGDMTYTDPNGGEIKTTVGGTYGGGQITVYDATGEAIERVAKHEIGHHTYFEKLSDDARRRWEAFWAAGDNKLLKPAGKMPTGYAGTDADEGFAEAFEYYHDRPGLLHPDTRQLIEDILKGLP